MWPRQQWHDQWGGVQGFNWEDGRHPEGGGSDVLAADDWPLQQPEDDLQWGCAPALQPYGAYRWEQQQSIINYSPAGEVCQYEWR